MTSSESDLLTVRIWYDPTGVKQTVIVFGSTKSFQDVGSSILFECINLPLIDRVLSLIS
jgi:hypothetical protein